MPPDVLLPVALDLRLSAGLDSVRPDSYRPRVHPGSPLDRLRQYRRHQCAAYRAQKPAAATLLGECSRARAR